MKEALISIIVPVYKAEKTLSKCIESIVKQDYCNWELLLVDDGSPDSCPLICDNWSQRDDRIYVFHKENGGVSSARNYGLDRIKGEWVVFIDSDDWVEPNYLSSFKLDPKFDLEFQGYVREFDYDLNVTHGFTYNGETTPPMALIEAEKINVLNCPWCKLFSKRLVENIRFDRNLSYGEDYLFVLQILQRVNACYLSTNIGYHYVETSGSLTKKKVNFDSNIRFRLSCVVNRIQLNNKWGDSNLAILNRRRSLLQFRKTIEEYHIIEGKKPSFSSVVNKFSIIDNNSEGMSRTEKFLIYSLNKKQYFVLYTYSYLSSFLKRSTLRKYIGKFYHKFYN